MANLPTMEELLKAGVHFGHQASHWHPKMEPYIYTTRNGVHIIDLKKTQDRLTKAIEFITKTVADGGNVLFVGTKPQAQPIIETYAKQAGMPYIKSRWIGGTLTNYSEFKNSIQRYVELLRQRDSGGWDKYTKKERSELQKEVDRLHEFVSGLVTMDRPPKAVFIVDIRSEKTAVKEANVMNIPIIALCDTNTNPLNVQHPIPANDDATRGIELMVKAISEACVAGVKSRKVVVGDVKKATPAAAPVSAPAPQVSAQPAAAAPSEEKKTVAKKPRAAAKKAEVKSNA